MSTANVCPVCGSKNVKASEKCPDCGFLFPAPVAFLSGGSKQKWESLVRGWKQQTLLACQQRLSAPGRFAVNRNGIFFADPINRKLVSTISFSAADENVGTISATDKRILLCYNDGKLVLIENEPSGFSDLLRDLPPVRIAALGSDCVYAVLPVGGRVEIRGTTFDRDTINTWTDIESLSVGEYHLIGVRSDGTAVIAMRGGYKGEYLDAVAGWRNLRQVDSATGCAVGLQNDGSVLFVGRDGDPRAAIRDSKNIVSVALDDQFAYALDAEGRIHIEGDRTPRPYLNDNRLEMEKLENVAAICAHKSCAAAMLLNGEMRGFGLMQPAAAVCEIRPVLYQTHPRR